MPLLRRNFRDLMLTLNYFLLPVLRLTDSALSCGVPMVEIDSIQNEFFAEPPSGGSNWTLHALVSWHAPAQEGMIGYNGYYVRFDTEACCMMINSPIKCSIGDLYEYPEYQFTEDNYFTFSDVKFGFKYIFTVYTVNTAEERRNGLRSEMWIEDNLLDCYNITQDVEYCRSRPIPGLSAPVNPRATCLTLTPTNDMTFESVFIEWNAPLQVAPDHNISYFVIEIYVEGTAFSSVRRYLAEEETVAVQTDLYAFSANLGVLTDGNNAILSRNETYVVRTYGYVTDGGEFGKRGNTIFFSIDTIDLPVCVDWTEWSSWTPEDCCGIIDVQSQNRSCEDPWETGVPCEGLDLQNRTCDCSTPLLSPLYIGLVTCGTAIVAACFIALILKYFCQSSDDEDEDSEIFLPDKNVQTDSPPEPVSIFGNKEIRREDLGVHLDTLLGSGAQGSVYMGKLRVNKKEWIDVAVKTPKLDDMTDSPANQIIRDTFLKEVQFSIEIQGVKGHPNILPVFGCCTTKEPYYLVTPFMKHGDLLGFVRKCKKVRLEDDNARSPYNLSHVNQLNILRHIARGMEFLSGARYYMGDLAASNVLIGEDLVAKIADFGLGYDLYLTTGAVQRKQDRPFKFRPRWVSLETYESNGATCNLKSDVWSFGIVMYEVYSFGELPYSQKWSNRQLLEALKEGYRLERPPECPPDIYNVMRRCWHTDPNQRPTFNALVKEFTQKIHKLTQRESEQQGYITVSDSDAPGLDNPGLDLGDENTDNLDDHPSTLEHIDEGKAITNDDISTRDIGTENEQEITSGETLNSGAVFIPDPNQNRETSTGSHHNIGSEESGRPDDHHIWANLHRDQGEPHSTEFIPISDQNRNTSRGSEAIDIKDYHDFERFPDNEAKSSHANVEKEVTL